jgi:hypothetical protein
MTKIDLPNLTPEQKQVVEEYAKASLNYTMAKMRFATFLANNSMKLLVGVGILLVIMWTLGFWCGKISHF